MKKIYSLLSFVILVGVAKAQFPAPYCAETYSSGVEPITLVLFNTINNTSPAATGGVAHQDFTAISTSIKIGRAHV